MPKSSSHRSVILKKEQHYATRIEICILSTKTQTQRVLRSHRSAPGKERKQTAKTSTSSEVKVGIMPCAFITREDPEGKPQRNNRPSVIRRDTHIKAGPVYRDARTMLGHSSHFKGVESNTGSKHLLPQRHRFATFRLCENKPSHHRNLGTHSSNEGRWQQLEFSQNA